MRPTTAHDDNIFDLNSLLHPGTAFEHPRDVASDFHLSLAEKRGHSRVMGLGCIRDRFVPVAPSARGAEVPRLHRRHFGSVARARRWSAASAWRQAGAAAVGRTARCGLTGERQCHTAKAGESRAHVGRADPDPSATGFPREGLSPSDRQRHGLDQRAIAARRHDLCERCPGSVPRRQRIPRHAVRPVRERDRGRGNQDRRETD